MDFLITPFIGALPIKFGMGKTDLLDILPKDAIRDIPNFGKSSLSFFDNRLRLFFRNGKVAEIEFFRSDDDSQSMPAAEEFNIQIESEGVDPDVLNSDRAAHLLSKISSARYEPGIWLFPELGISVCVDSGSNISTSFCLFDKSLLSIHLEDTEDLPEGLS